MNGSTILGGVLRVGRHFQLVSTAPAAVIVGSTYLLLTSGAPTHAPSLTSASASVANLNFTHLALLVLSTVVVGMIMHPFEFVLLQALEGYWGTTKTAIDLMSSRAGIYRGRRGDLEKRATASAASRKALDAALSRNLDVQTRTRLESARLNDTIAGDQLSTAAKRYPRDEYRTLPTRLGNRLRSFEDSLGQPHGVASALHLGPYLIALGRDEDVEYVHDARTSLDLAARFTLAWGVVFAISLALLWPYGGWLVIPLAAMGLAHLSYYGAVYAADEYGTALQVLFDLNVGSLIESIPTLGSLDRSRLNKISTRLSRHGSEERT